MHKYLSALFVTLAFSTQALAADGVSIGNSSQVSQRMAVNDQHASVEVDFAEFRAALDERLRQIRVCGAQKKYWYNNNGACTS